jgi:hypothetical protein
MPTIKGFSSKTDMQKVVGEVFKPTEKIIDEVEIEKPKKSIIKK